MRTGARNRIGILTGAAYAAALLIFGLPGLSGATTINVSTEAEYRQALTDLSADASGPHTINVTADITIAGATDPTYTGSQDLTINGNGFTLDAANNSRVLFHNSTADLNIADLTAVKGTTAGEGGAIFSGGPVTVTDSTISGSTSLQGGGIRSTGLTVTNSTINDNTATNAGGGIRTDGSVTVTNSTISNNGATVGGGIFTGMGGQLAVTGSTISGNAADGQGGGVWADEPVSATNSTITGNSAGNGGGIFTTDSVSLTYATVVDNAAAGGPGAANLTVGIDLTSFGSVVALPQGGTPNCDIFGTTSSTYSYDDDGSCGFTGTGDTQNGPDPQLGPLASNGGPTQTRLPQAGSSLIDAIPQDDCHEEVTDDQRGLSRPRDGDDDGGFECDVGAVEVDGDVPPDGPGAAEPVAGEPSFTG